MPQARPAGTKKSLTSRHDDNRLDLRCIYHKPGVIWWKKPCFNRHLTPLRLFQKFGYSPVGDGATLRLADNATEADSGRHHPGDRRAEYKGVTSSRRRLSEPIEEDRR